MGSKTAVSVPRKSVQAERDEEYFVTPEFIYGGPFIEIKKPSPFIDSTTPVNLPLQGTFRRSFAYFSLKDRLPVILTKIIDYLSRDGSKIKSANNGATDEDLRSFMAVVTKLKNDLVTNKDYEPFTVDTPEAKKWNLWIEQQENKKYFTNTWMFSECYVYRKLYEGCELTKGLKDFDYFTEQKNESFQNLLVAMCQVSDKVLEMLNKSDKDKRKADFVTLLKLCLWANKCDLSLSCGSQVNLSGAVEGATAKPLNPFQMVLDFKDKLLVDDTGKIADLVVNKAEAMRKAIAANTTFKFKCSCHRLANAFGMPLCEQAAEEDVKGSPTATPAEGEAPVEEAPKVPCPAKMTVPNHVMFDIICDNAGYELFADLCVASFLIEQEIVEMVRFHVKRMPWFVSDVTIKDFQYVVSSCMNATFKLDIPGEGDEETTSITSDNLRALGAKWNQYLVDGKFVVMAEEFWTYPHVYRDMKKYDYNMYRKLQYAIALLFKGDLNYRKLVGDRNVNPYTSLETNLQGFIPAPIIAVRTVKAETVCGLPKGKMDALNKINEKWMQTGDYGVIQLCPKAEPLKIADRPCVDYCNKCFGVVCPEHDKDM